MFTKILIANRGEIACRVAATARRMGIRTVAVYSDADADAAHVRACDEAVHIGGPAAKDSYLQAERILQVAQQTGAQAIHPGYGFLSENAGFARQCQQSGISFIGPPPEAIEAMGLKAQSKALMEKAGVPLVPGYHGEQQSPEDLARHAQDMGYPVMIKASAGGGGKGMRIVKAPQDFFDALASCQREAQASFGNADVLVERYVSRPRHIEIQIFADTHGQVLSLHERDCSVQRRHQKVLEESPAPGLSAQRRAEMGAAAVAAAKAVGYVGAGTVEFIAEPMPDGDLRFYFMEMNTRLQVEHPVTEAVTGLDLVEWQLRVAAGEALPLAQEQIRQHGHAIEARLCAESPEQGFLPATGRLEVLRWPPHVSFRMDDAMAGANPAPLRVDAGVRQGDVISPHYDPMIAKVIVWGRDREQALARMDQALSGLRICGLSTNAAFLRRIVRSPSFAKADLDTALIERERDFLFQDQALALPWVLAATVAAQAQQRSDAPSWPVAGSDPWAAGDDWRMHGTVETVYDISVGDQAIEVIVQRGHRQGLRLVWGDSGADFQWQCLASQGPGHWDLDLILDGQRLRAEVYRVGDRFHVYGPDAWGVAAWHDRLAEAGAHAEEGGKLSAPMPGKLIALNVQAGDKVSAGQAVAVMEAMKMEHTLQAPRDGVVSEVFYRVGDLIPDGEEIMALARAIDGGPEQKES